MLKKPVFSIGVIIAFITPTISVGIGLATAWLFVHLHILGVFHINERGMNQAIIGVVVFAVTAGLHYAAAHFHWLPIVLANLRRKENGQVVPPPATAVGGVGDTAAGTRPRR